MCPSQGKGAEDNPPAPEDEGEEGDSDCLGINSHNPALLKDSASKKDQLEAHFIQSSSRMLHTIHEESDEHRLSANLSGHCETFAIVDPRSRCFGDKPAGVYTNNVNHTNSAQNVHTKSSFYSFIDSNDSPTTSSFYSSIDSPAKSSFYSSLDNPDAHSNGIVSESRREMNIISNPQSTSCVQSYHQNNDDGSSQNLYALLVNQNGETARVKVQNNGLINCSSALLRCKTDDNQKPDVSITPLCVHGNDDRDIDKTALSNTPCSKCQDNLHLYKSQNVHQDIDITVSSLPCDNREQESVLQSLLKSKSGSSIAIKKSVSFSCGTYEEKTTHTSEVIDIPEPAEGDCQATRALIDINNSSSTAVCSSLACVPTHGLTLPLHSNSKDAPRCLMVVPLFGTKQKFTKRQLIQLAGMMLLGFIFVGIILAWIFSPTFV